MDRLRSSDQIYCGNFSTINLIRTEFTLKDDHGDPSALKHATSIAEGNAMILSLYICGHSGLNPYDIYFVSMFRL